MTNQEKINYKMHTLKLKEKDNKSFYIEFDRRKIHKIIFRALEQTETWVVAEEKRLALEAKEAAKRQKLMTKQA